MAEHDIVVNTDEFPGNSNKSKEELVKPKVEKVVTGKVEKHKPSTLKKMGSMIFSDISEDDLRTEIVFDYLIPTIKDTVVDLRVSCLPTKIQ